MQKKEDVVQPDHFRRRSHSWRLNYCYAGMVALILLLSANLAESQDGNTTGLVYHEDYLKHDTGKFHPERKDRLTAIINRLREKNLLPQLLMITPTPASPEWIELVHSPEYMAEVERSCKDGKQYLHSKDTVISSDSYAAACMAAGGVLCAIDAVMCQKVKNAFCAVRPPGHHASRGRAMGFCVFNNVAIGARYAQKKYKCAKVLIVDFDVHHGNGTQNIFNDDPSVLYFSIHRSPFYPGTGNADEKGAGKGYGTKINIPLAKGGGNQEYIKAFNETFRPAALAFHPDFIIISAGFDAHKDDPLGGMNVTPEGYAAITAIIKDVAEKCCAGRLVSVLEGGYGLDGLADSAEAHISVLLGKKKQSF
jgi:acetoin utilization deacetylase AcuC-like enzyme